MRSVPAFVLLLLAWCLCAPFAPTRVASADVLWDQLSGLGGYGFASQDFEEVYDCYDCLTADDFVVPEPGWSIEQVVWDVFLDHGGSPPVHGIHIYIMPDRGDNLADYDNPVYYEFAPSHTVYNGTNTVTLATPVTLSPGHYFFGAAPALDWSSYGSCDFVVTTYAPVWQEAHMINPGGCFGSGSDWFQPSPGYDASFRLCGETLTPFRPNAVIDLPVGDPVIRAGDHVLFAGTATDEGGYIVDWLWTFGEGSGVDDMHVEDPGYVQFNNLGVFEVIFNAQDNDGNWDWAPDSREVTVKGSRVYVDKDSPGPEHDGQTWDTALLTIQGGVDVCLPDGEVWVADGTYVQNIVMPEGVAIYGGFLGAEPGGYEAELDQRDWVNHIATIDGNQSGSCIVMAVDARVDGFTITNGSGLDGGGVHCDGLGESGEIINNTIVANAATDEGGGVYCQASSPLIENNTFAQDDSSNGAAIYCYKSSPAIIGNVMTENTADSEGGALCCYMISSPLVTGNSMIRNSAGDYGGAVSCSASSVPSIVNNNISDNSARYGGGGIECTGVAATLVGNSISRNLARYGGGIYCAVSPCSITNNSVTANSASDNGGGIYCHGASPTIANNAVTTNSADGDGGGIACEGDSSPRLSRNDFWGNTPEDYYGCTPGEGDISEDPMFVDPEAGDFHLDPGSPCIDIGDNDAPGLPETDFEGDPRIVDGDGDKIPEVDIGADECVSRCWPTAAPNPEPYSPGALFGRPGAGFPGWVWFGIPLDPSDCCGGENCYDPNTLLGFECNGRLWYWDKYAKAAQVYRPPFLVWDLSVGEGYLLRLESVVENPSYSGEVTAVDYEVRLGRQGWTWVGVPALYELGYTDFMNSVRVQYPVGGLIRTAGQDYGEIPRNWVQWGWAFWDTYYQASRTFTPYLPFGCNTCYPWLGYRVWVNVGTATHPDDPDQVTLIWP